MRSNSTSEKSLKEEIGALTHTAIKGRNTKWEPIVEIMGFNLSLSLSISSAGQFFTCGQRRMHAMRTLFIHRVPNCRLQT